MAFVVVLLAVTTKVGPGKSGGFFLKKPSAGSGPFGPLIKHTHIHLRIRTLTRIAEAGPSGPGGSYARLHETIEDEKAAVSTILACYEALKLGQPLTWGWLGVMRVHVKQLIVQQLIIRLGPGGGVH
jgi:hypothetical protein